MKITVENTSKIVTLKTEHGQVPARVWEGETDTGIPVHCFITRIAVKRDQDTAQFEKELKECRAPSVELDGIPLRLIL